MSQHQTLHSANCHNRTSALLDEPSSLLKRSSLEAREEADLFGFNTDQFEWDLPNSSVNWARG